MPKNLATKTKKNRENKTLFTIAMVLMLTMTALMAGVQPANSAVTEWDTFFYVMIAPNPVGVGQTTIITLQIDKTNPLAAGIVAGENFRGLTAKITNPDGTTETKGPYQSYAMANMFFYYTPKQVGTYTVEGSWPGQWVNTTTYQRWYKTSSASTTFVVQQEPIPSYQNIPLPTDYWTRPLNAEIKGWWQVADNWLMPRYDNPTAWRFSYTAVAPYTSAPNSPHILWKQPVAFGGVVGGPQGDKTYRTGLSYEPWYASALILSGRIIYAVKGVTDGTVFGTRCIDLYTGEEIWYLDDVNIAFAQVLQFDSGNEHGGLAYLWRTTGTATNGTWYMYDAFEGKQVLTVTNVTSGTTRFGPNGELLSYSLSGTGANRRLIMWNSTRAGLYGDPTTSSQTRVSQGEEDSYWSPGYQALVDGRKGIQWNVSVPQLWENPSIQIIQDGYIFARYRQPTRPTATQTLDTQYPPITLDVAYPATIAKLPNGSYPTSIDHLWAINRTDLKGHSQSLCDTISDGVYVDFDGGLARLYAYDIKTGQKLWETESLTGWGLFSGSYYSGGAMAAAYGKVYNSGYDGHVRAYNIKTGELEWDYYMGDAPYLENAYGTWPIYGFTIADGKIFVTNDEHSPDSILWRGAKLTVLDAETGDLVWSIGARLRQSVAADGILTTLNVYDMQIYTFGKGPSKTTVAAPLTGVPKGTAVMVTGTVTDQTPASKDTPAISDESMGAWMEYLHMQKPFPENATGVPVTITAVDPNGNTVNVGNVTSDNAGSFGVAWVPPVEGTYKITAKFAGTESYGSSYASTYLVVGPAAPTPAPVTPTPPPAATPTAPVTPTPPLSPSQPPTPAENPYTALYVGVAAIVIVVAIAAAAVVLRRRK